MVSVWKKSAAVCALVALGGCVGVSEGPVTVGASIDPATQPIRTAMQDECRNRASARTPADPEAPAVGTPEEMRIRRNNLVTAFIDAANESYYAYERDLLAFSRQNDLGSALALQILSAFGAASGSHAVSEATNITSGVVSGSQSAFAKSLLNQTVSVLQTHMRASRAAQHVTIIQHLALPYSEWNMCQALSEARAYEQAGTLNAALAAMAASAADEERDNNADVQQAIREIGYSREALPAALRAYFQRGADQRRVGLAALNTLIARGAIARPSVPVNQYLFELYSGGGNPGELAALVRQIVKDEGGSEAGNALNAALPQ